MNLDCDISSSLPAEASSRSHMPLAMARAGEIVEVVTLRGSLGLQRRLAEMGLSPGSRFRVETSDPAGPVVIAVKGSRLILGRGLVQQVLVCLVRQRTGDSR